MISITDLNIFFVLTMTSVHCVFAVDNIDGYIAFDLRGVFKSQDDAVKFVDDDLEKKALDAILYKCNVNVGAFDITVKHKKAAISHVYMGPRDGYVYIVGETFGKYVIEETPLL